ncbi:MAG: DUF4860 domain-containing protein [Oscillospiraceae bacterium]
MKKQKGEAVDFLFILGLFFALCSCSVLVVLLGAKVYKKTTQAMDTNFTQRTGLEYIVEKARQNDMDGGLSLGKIEGEDALIFTRTQGENKFYTYIYYYNGYLREIYLANDAQPILTAGQKITKAQGVEIEQEDDIFTVSITGQDNQKSSVYLSCVSEGEDNV